MRTLDEHMLDSLGVVLEQHDSESNSLLDELSCLVIALKKSFTSSILRLDHHHVLIKSFQLCHVLIESSQLYHVLIKSSQLCHVLIDSSQLCHVLIERSQLCHVLIKSSQLCHVLIKSSQFSDVLIKSSQLCNPIPVPVIVLTYTTSITDRTHMISCDSYQPLIPWYIIIYPWMYDYISVAV